MILLPEVGMKGKLARPTVAQITIGEQDRMTALTGLELYTTSLRNPLQWRVKRLSSPQIQI